jgi:hypothetical protein
MNWHLLDTEGYCSGPYATKATAVEQARNDLGTDRNPKRGWGFEGQPGIYELHSETDSGERWIVRDDTYRGYFIPLGSHMLPEGPERDAAAERERAENEANDDDTPCGYCGETFGYTYNGGHSERCCRSCNGC